MSSLWKVDKFYDPNQGDMIKVVVSSKDDSSHCYSISFQERNGNCYESFCHADRWESINAQVRYRDGDIIVASYPKCGTTWVEQIVLLLLNKGNNALMNPAMKNTVQALSLSLNDNSSNSSIIGKIWLEACIDQDPDRENRMGKQASPISIEQFNNLPFYHRVIKTHAFPATLLGSDRKGVEGLRSKQNPSQQNVKVILITRNPFDACVSSYFYGFNAYKRGWPFEAWASVWIEGLHSSGDWFQWNKEWFQQHLQFPGNSLWMSYEDLVASPREQLIRIIQFLNIPNVLVEYNENPNEFLNHIIEGSSFERMKSQAEVVDSIQRQNGQFIDYHLRKGECGDWKNYFQVPNENEEEQGVLKNELLRRIIEKFHEFLDGTGLNFITSNRILDKFMEAK